MTHCVGSWNGNDEPVEHASVEPVAKGPIIVSVDESGTARGQGPHCQHGLRWPGSPGSRSAGALVAYSGDSGERLLALPPGRWDETASWTGSATSSAEGVLDVPSARCRGTTRTARTGRRHRCRVRHRRACRIAPILVTLFLAWKHQAQARLITLVIGSEPGDLTDISDEIHELDAGSLRGRGRTSPASEHLDPNPREARQPSRRSGLLAFPFLTRKNLSDAPPNPTAPLVPHRHEAAGRDHDLELLRRDHPAPRPHRGPA